ncbi:MAG: hypothetical protein GXP30_00730 [Verrucomicrobia bacterium]|nr:hypothetical protein [Verrucomicrobiota bacterium]
MKTTHYSFACLLCILLTSCAYKDEPTYNNSKGEKFCSLHHQRLISDNGFAQSPEVCILPTDEYTAIAATFPNHNSDLAEQKSELYTLPVKYSYCQSCRDDLSKKLKN